MAKRRDVTAHVRQTLQPYFTNKLSSSFGRSTLRMMLERLRTAGIVAPGLADEVLIRGGQQMAEYLRRGGAAPYPESLFQAICCDVLNDFLEERAREEAAKLMRVLGGELELGDFPVDNDSAVLERVREAIDHLPEPFQRFMRLDFSEARPEMEIRLALELRDHEEYLHLKRLSLAALRQAIERLISSKPLRVVS